MWPSGDTGRSLSLHAYGGAPVCEKISGPIRDRIDINQAFLPLRRAYLKAALQRAESSAVVAARVMEARARQRRRLAGSGWQTNGEVSGTYLRRHLPLPAVCTLSTRPSTVVD
jgi:predicted ATPase with chaperone activity